MTSLTDWTKRKQDWKSQPRKATPAAAKPVINSAPDGWSLAIISGKGGVGKTWLSVSLAEALATPERRPMLFDGDLGLANVDIQLGLLPRRTLADVAKQKIDVKEAIVDAGSFDVLPGASGSAALASIRPDYFERLTRALSQIGSEYPVTLYDLGSGINRPTVQLALSAKAVLVLITADPTSLTDAYAVIKVLRACRESMNIFCVVNFADSKVQGRETFDNFARVCETHLSFKPDCAGIIRRDAKVTSAIRSQANLLKIYPQSRAAVDIRELASWIDDRFSSED